MQLSSNRRIGSLAVCLKLMEKESRVPVPLSSVTGQGLLASAGGIKSNNNEASFRILNMTLLM